MHSRYNQLNRPSDVHARLFSLQYTLLPEDLQCLLKEVEELRKAAEDITCNCDEPDCPFRFQPRVFHERSLSLPIADCEYVSEDEDSYEQIEMCRFLRTQPARRGAAPNRHARFAPRAPRERSGSIPNPLVARNLALRRASLSSVVYSLSARPISN